MSSLTLQGKQLWQPDGSIRIEVVQGRYGWEPGEFRGEDTIIPGMEGRDRRNRVFDRHVIVLAGHVKGLGATLADQQLSFQASMEYLHDLWDPTTATANLIDTLPDGTRYKADVRYVSATWEDDILRSFRRVSSIEFECVENPPWTVWT